MRLPSVLPSPSLSLGGKCSDSNAVEEFSGYISPFPDMPPVDGGCIWHYTTTQGAMGILESGRLWATQYRYLNDELEFEYGLQLCENVLVEVEEISLRERCDVSFLRTVLEYLRTQSTYGDLFVTCASAVRDSLSQWRGYTEGVGHAIGIDVRQPLAFERKPLTGEEVFPVGVGEAGIDPRWLKVLYDRHEQRNSILAAFGYILATYNKVGCSCDLIDFYSDYLASILMLCKHESFSDERELRVIGQGRATQVIRHRASGMGVVPYQLLGGVEGGGEGVVPSVARRLKIAQVQIGPTRYRDLAVRGMGSFLNAVGLSGVDVTQSMSPFRG